MHYGSIAGTLPAVKIVANTEAVSPSGQIWEPKYLSGVISAARKLCLLEAKEDRNS
jgi:hypothetical protein